MWPKNCRNCKITLTGHCKGHCLLSHISVYCFCSSRFHSSCQENVGTGRLLLKDMGKDIVFFTSYQCFLTHSSCQKIAETEGLLLRDMAKATVYYFISMFTVFVMIYG